MGPKYFLWEPLVHPGRFRWEESVPWDLFSLLFHPVNFR